MADTAYTPGPWQVSEGPQGLRFVTTLPQPGVRPGVSIASISTALGAQDSNARLIAAAPDLYEAAQRAAVRLKWLLEVALDCGATFDDHEDAALSSTMSDLGAALQKVGGDD